MKNKTIASVYGLGYVGLTLSIVLAEHDFFVIGVEKDKKKKIMLKKKKMFLHETNIESRYSQQYKKNFILDEENRNKLKSKIHIITVGTPIDKFKKLIIAPFEKILTSISKNLKKGDLLVVRSTVPIGFCNEFIIPFVKKKTNYIPGIDYNIVFAPERTIEGKALDELVTNPQIIGGYSSKCNEAGSDFFRKFCNNISLVKNLESAEMCKLVDNTFRDVSFSYANEISMLADKFGVDVHEIIDACNRNYKRNNIPRPSPGVGGPCLIKDPHIMALSAKKKKFDTSLISTARKVNENTIKYNVKKIISFLPYSRKNHKILFCGVAFKGSPETNDTRNSTTVDLIETLKKKLKRVKIYAHDFIVSNKELKKLGYIPFDIKKDKNEIDAVIVANNHKGYSFVDFNKLLKRNNTKLIFDGWKLLYNQKFDQKVKYIGVGF
jgi:UDP-N-acetyl-D-mannosaminuronic acid dehydrogenase